MEVSWAKEDAQRAAADVGDDARTKFGAAMPKSRPQSRPALGKDARSPVIYVRDDLAEQYSCMADDATLATKKREASMLFSAAERHLHEEDADSCLKTAQEAVEIFREVGDSLGISDTLIVMIRAYQFSASVENKDANEALRMAESELQISRVARDRRGEAMMLLGLAEVKCFWRGRLELSSALDSANSALDIFTEEKDTKMQAYAHLALVNIYFLKEKCADVLTAAQEALKLFKAIGDEKGQAKALHGHALSFYYKADYTNMMKYGKEALDLYKKLGVRRLEAFELSVIAQFHLLSDKPQKALGAAQEGLAITRDITFAGKAPEAFLLLLVVESLSEINRKLPALKEAKKGLKRFQDGGDQRGVSFGLEIVFFANYELEAYEDALVTAEEALDVIREFGDSRQELNVQFLLAALHVRREEPKKALEAMQAALAIATDLEDTEEAANVHRMMSDIHIESGDARPALQAANEARSSFESIDDKLGEASALILTSFAHSLDMDTDKAISAATEAQEIYEEQENVEGECIALRLLTDLHMTAESHDLALTAAQRRLELYEDIGNKKEMAYALHLIASVHIASDNPEEAERVALEAQALCKTMVDRQLEVGLLIELTSIQVMFMDREGMEAAPSPACIAARTKALKYVTEAVSLATKYLTKKQDKPLRARALFWRGQILFYSGSDTEAQRAAQYAEKLFKECDRPSGASEALVLQAFILDRLEERDKAMEVANAALEIARSCGSQAAEQSAMAFFEKIQREEEERRQREQAQQALMYQQAAAFGGGPVVAAGGDESAVAASVAAPAAPAGLDPLMTKQKLMRMVKDVIASDDELETDSPFMEAGMDSLSSVQLMTEVSKEFQLSLSPSLIFDFPTVRAMVDHLVEESKSAALAY